MFLQQGVITYFSQISCLTNIYMYLYVNTHTRVEKKRGGNFEPIKNVWYQMSFILWRFLFGLILQCFHIHKLSCGLGESPKHQLYTNLYFLKLYAQFDGKLWLSNIYNSITSVENKKKSYFPQYQFLLSHYVLAI